MTALMSLSALRSHSSLSDFLSEVVPLAQPRDGSFKFGFRFLLREPFACLFDCSEGGGVAVSAGIIERVVSAVHRLPSRFALMMVSSFCTADPEFSSGLGIAALQCLKQAAELVKIRLERLQLLVKDDQLPAARLLGLAVQAVGSSPRPLPPAARLFLFPAVISQSDRKNAAPPPSAPARAVLQTSAGPAPGFGL